jgi:hypothetical protein
MVVRMRRFMRWFGQRFLAAMSLGIGIGITIWLALRSKDARPLTGPEQAAWATLAIGANLAGGALLGRIGRVSRGHARSAVRRLQNAGQSVRTAQRILEDGIGESSAKMETRITVAARSLDDVASVLVNGILDWRDVHIEAVRDVTGATEDDET